MDTTALPDWLQAYDPPMLWLMAGGAVLLILVLLFVIIGLFRNRITIKGLEVQTFQIAPLGRDAFLKLGNPSEPLTLLHAKILGRKDVIVKNQVAGQLLVANGTYSLLLEASGNTRLSTDFSLQVTFVDGQRKTYEQQFTLSPPKSLYLKRK